MKPNFYILSISIWNNRILNSFDKRLYKWNSLYLPPNSAAGKNRQPLVVNVNIEFTSIVDGVLSYNGDQSGEVPVYEQVSYGAIDQVISLNAASQSIDGSVLPTVVPTLGGIIRSFQPVQISGVTYGYGPQQSTRDDVMVGGNGGGGSLLGGINSGGGLLSAFDEVYTYATSSAMGQGGFGGLLSDVAETATSIARGVSTVTNAVNQTVSAATNLANVVSGGAFSESEFGQSVREFQSDLAQGARTVSNVAGATATLATTVNNATNTFGSLLKTPIV